MRSLAAMIRRISKDLFLITLRPPIPGFNHFIGSWFYQEKPSFVIDVGPAVTAESLLGALHDLKVRRLDYIFLTHIHMDHAGGIGEIAAAFPETPIICHPAGIPHLADPSRLWESTVKTLGQIATAFGPVKPVPMSRFVPADQFISAEIVPVMTPGHAAHHVSYLTEQHLFAGEVAGVFLPAANGADYLRPATPPPLFLDHFIESLDALIDKKPLKICYGHYGLAGNAVRMLSAHKRQLLLWKETISAEIKGFQTETGLSVGLQKLLRLDPFLAGFWHLDPPTRKRERMFLKNSLKGFAGYLNR